MSIKYKFLNRHFTFGGLLSLQIIVCVLLESISDFKLAIFQVADVLDTTVSDEKVSLSQINLS